MAVTARTLPVADIWQRALYYIAVPPSWLRSGPASEDLPAGRPSQKQKNRPFRGRLRPKLAGG